jgi:large subunit ribosomal protein L28
MQKCEITGKGKQYGNNVSFSQRHTKKVWKPNLQSKTLTIDGKKVKMKISTQAIRSSRKRVFSKLKSLVKKINRLMGGFLILISCLK